MRVDMMCWLKWATAQRIATRKLLSVDSDPLGGRTEDCGPGYETPRGGAGREQACIEDHWEAEPKDCGPGAETPRGEGGVGYYFEVLK